MRITIARDSMVGWLISRPHRITGFPQTVAYDQDRAEAIRKAETALGKSFPERVKSVKPMHPGSGFFELED